MKRSKFNLTHMHSTTADAGKLIPFLLQPTLPGDRFRIGLRNFIRCQPMVAPLMHEVYLYTQYWYVPYRILWDEWEDFITGGSDLSVSPSFPTITLNNPQIGSLSDYFGFPNVNGIQISAMPFRAMAEIWNTRYRDEDLQSEVPISYASGADTTTSTDLLSPSWTKDYFTTARPWTQRGADVMVPIVAGGSETSTYHKHTCTVRVDNGLPQEYFVDGIPTTQNGSTWRPNLTSVGQEVVQNMTIAIKGANYSTRNTNKSIPPGTYSFSDDNPDNFVYLFADMFLREYQIMESINNNGQALLENIATYVNQTLATSSLTRTQHFFCSGSFNYVENHNNATYNGMPLRLIVMLENDETVSAPGVNTTFQTYTAFDYGNSGSYILFFPQNYSDDNGNYPRVEGTYYQSLSVGGSFSVRDLRASAALQRYSERSLKYGNRYEEFIMREFGVKPRDSRIQRPEYLGGGRGILNISEVLQTAEGTDTTVGTMRGHGVASVAQRPIRFKSPEHGIIIGLLSIRPKAIYTQGIEREFLKRSRLDFFTPELANIGMQEVLQQELFATSGNRDEIFGYSDRYQEYRYRKSLVTGEFRDTLNYWNMARVFDNAPNLNDEFINMEYSSEVFKRPFAVQDQSYHSFLIMLENVIHAWRPIPKRAKDILK